jgi:uncharacterized protein (TIGR00255 family)
MTGFGLAERAWDERGSTLRVELRSVNARFLELKIRQPFGVAIEHALRKQVEARLGRGRVDLGLQLEGSGETGEDALASLGVDRQKVAAVIEALSTLAGEAYQASFQVSHPTSLDLLRFLVGARNGNNPAGPAQVFEHPPAFVHELVDEAVTRLLAMREQEGEALARVLGELLGELEGQVAVIAEGLRGEPERLYAAMTERVSALLARVAGGDLDRDRIAQEVALLVSRGDVSEELARVASHVGQARATLARAPAVGQGKTLDFLAQELLREVTTIGSKITSHEGSAIVIAAKQTIERIREQVQNVE